MKQYLKNWNFMRVLRLTVGIFIIIMGIQTRDWLFVFLGAAFSIMPLFNVGCCSVNGCATPPSRRNTHSEEITFEEIK